MYYFFLHVMIQSVAPKILARLMNNDTIQEK